MRVVYKQDAPNGAGDIIKPLPAAKTQPFISNQADRAFV